MPNYKKVHNLNKYSCCSYNAKWFKKFNRHSR